MKIRVWTEEKKGQVLEMIERKKEVARRWLYKPLPQPEFVEIGVPEFFKKLFQERRRLSIRTEENATLRLLFKSRNKNTFFTFVYMDENRQAWNMVRCQLLKDIEIDKIYRIKKVSWSRIKQVKELVNGLILEPT
ncbi:MAG: hypothetical protein V1845_03545 [bacterium]